MLRVPRDNRGSSGPVVVSGGGPFLGDSLWWSRPKGVKSFPHTDSTLGTLYGGLGALGDFLVPWGPGLE